QSTWKTPPNQVGHADSEEVIPPQHFVISDDLPIRPRSLDLPAGSNAVIIDLGLTHSSSGGPDFRESRILAAKQAMISLHTVCVESLNIEDVTTPNQRTLPTQRQGPCVTASRAGAGPAHPTSSGSVPVGLPA